MSRYWVEHYGGTWTTVDQAANHFQLQAKKEQDRLRALAMSGDMVFVVTPVTLGSSAAAIATAVASEAAGNKFKRTVTMRLETAAGEVHTWWSGTRTIGIGYTTNTDGSAAIADTATATTAKFVDGVATATIEYTLTWAAADESVFTLTAGDVLGYTLSNKTSTDTVVE
jgi:hypothetical protein